MESLDKVQSASMFPDQNFTYRIYDSRNKNYLSQLPTVQKNFFPWNA